MTGAEIMWALAGLFSASAVLLGTITLVYVIKKNKNK